MSDVISIAEFAAYIVAILVLSAAVTALVVTISPSESAKAQRAAKKNQSA